MDVTYTDWARHRTGDFPLLETATLVLENIVRGSTDPVTAVWDRPPDDHGRVLYTLTLKDFSGEARGVFTPDDLGDVSRMRRRIGGVWSDLLHVRMDKILAGMREDR